MILQRKLGTQTSPSRYLHLPSQPSLDDVNGNPIIAMSLVPYSVTPTNAFRSRRETAALCNEVIPLPNIKAFFLHCFWAAFALFNMTFLRSVAASLASQLDEQHCFFGAASVLRIVIYTGRLNCLPCMILVQ
jgi:hypothetical protein